MHDDQWPESWAPYLTWAKHHPPAKYDLCGSNLLHLSLDELKGARDSLEISGRNDDGYPPLVEAIAMRYGVGTERVATANGAAGAAFLTMGALLRPGDTVLAEFPGYDPLIGAARFLGAKVRLIERTWEDGWKIDVDRLAQEVIPSTRLIILTNLHNPTGVYTDPWTLVKIGDLADAVGAKVLVDEVYLETVTNLDTTPAATRSEAFISVSSLTKAFGLAGLRVGWVLADPAIIRRVRRVRDVVDAVGSIPSERLGVIAFEHIDQLLARARHILEPHALMLRRFVETRNELDWVAPAGGPIAFPRLLGTDDAEPFVDFARAKFGVGVVAGRHFGVPAHFRVAVADRRRVVEEGLEALGKALDAWARR
ncbi:MAG: aminotransferase class I/II-fold pyridoxal phosphate-dependent enzyme [Longimicrobiales bacterium]|nr:aminotransferase class I/II-fold pyridoxal phosphate-dependent enzyme [Longimicrobiales bacterium]